MSGEKKTCFVISPIGSDASDIRKRSDQILDHIIKPVLESRGYTVVRSDQISTPGSITNQLILNVVNADLVVADLTGLNPNVMYELGIRHAAQKPTIHICETSQKLPFDLLTHRTIFLSHADPESAERCRTLMARQVKDVEANPNAWDNPVTVALNVAALHAGDRLQDQALAEIVEELQGIRDFIQRLYGTFTPVDLSAGEEKPILRRAEWMGLQYVGSLLSRAGIHVPYNGGEPLDPIGYVNIIREAVEGDEIHPDGYHGVRLALEYLGPESYLAESSAAYRERHHYTRSIFQEYAASHPGSD